MARNKVDVVEYLTCKISVVWSRVRVTSSVVWLVCVIFSKRGFGNTLVIVSGELECAQEGRTAVPC